MWAVCMNEKRWLTVLEMRVLLDMNREAALRGDRLWAPLFVEQTLAEANERKAELNAVAKAKL